jgi:hypothetical protein
VDWGPLWACGQPDDSHLLCVCVHFRDVFLVPFVCHICLLPPGSESWRFCFSLYPRFAVFWDHVLCFGVFVDDVSRARNACVRECSLSCFSWFSSRVNWNVLSPICILPYSVQGCNANRRGTGCFCIARQSLHR